MNIFSTFADVIVYEHDFFNRNTVYENGKIIKINQEHGTE